MLVRHATLWPWPLTRLPWRFMVHQTSSNQSLYEIRAKWNNSWLSYWRFSTFLPCNFREWGIFTERYSGAWRRHRAIILTQNVCFRVQICCCILKRGQLKLRDGENDAKFRTFWPPVKMRKECARFLDNCWSFTYYQTSGIHGHPLRGCWARCIDKTVKRGNSQCIATSRRPTSRQSVISRFHYEYDAMRSLKSLTTDETRPSYQRPNLRNTVDGIHCATALNAVHW